MSAPRCPSCRERLSDAEAGLVGVWTCLYCEGAWLSSSDSGRLPHWPARDDGPGSPDAVALQCPGCEGEHFGALAKAGLSLHQCRSCASAFLPKKTVQALGRSLGGGQWGVGEALSLLWGRGHGAKADAAVLAVAVVALLFA